MQCFFSFLIYTTNSISLGMHVMTSLLTLENNIICVCAIYILIIDSSLTLHLMYIMQMFYNMSNVICNVKSKIILIHFTRFPYICPPSPRRGTIGMITVRTSVRPCVRLSVRPSVRHKPCYRDNFP